MCFAVHWPHFHEKACAQVGAAIAKCSLQMQILQKCEGMLEKRLTRAKELNEIQTGKRIQHELVRNRELQSIVTEVSRNINQAISEDDYERLRTEYKTQYSIDLALNQYYNELE